MKQILSAYGYGIVQDCFGLLKTLKDNGLSYDDFLDFVEKSKAESNPSIKKQIKKELLPKNKPVGKMDKSSTVSKENKPKVNKTKFLGVGETEKMSGVKCSKCGGNIFITPTCCTNPLKAQGFLRKGICGTCGIEFGIR